jgi:hypothetical protein
MPFFKEHNHFHMNMIVFHETNDDAKLLKKKAPKKGREKETKGAWTKVQASK